jgi:lipopolysaccharide/colanic/teichoic acid biosynthesis glycosyltransferase
MSLVGPRPEIAEYVNRYKHDYSSILVIKPGLTDISSIEFIDEGLLLNNYSNPEEMYLKTILPEKIKLYHRYIREQNMRTDILLIIKTIQILIFRIFGKKNTSHLKKKNLAQNQGISELRTAGILKYAEDFQGGLTQSSG